MYSLYYSLQNGWPVTNKGKRELLFSCTPLALCSNHLTLEYNSDCLLVLEETPKFR